MIGISISINSGYGIINNSVLIPDGMLGAVLITGQSEASGEYATPSINTSGNPSNSIMLTEGVRAFLNVETTALDRLMDTTVNTTNIALAEEDATKLAKTYGETPASGAASVLCSQTSEDIGFCDMARPSATNEFMEANSVHFANAIQALTLLGKNAGKDVYVLGVIFPWGAAESINNVTESDFSGYLRNIRTEYQKQISMSFGTTHEVQFYIPQFSAFNYTGTPENVAKAQLKESFENANVHLLPAHGILNKNGYEDNVHWTAESTEAIGQATADLILNNESGIRPLSITDSGSQIVITVDGTKGSLTTDAGITGLTDNGVRINAGTISSVVLGANTITVNYSGGTPTTVSVAYNTSASLPKDSTTDIWDGTNHCCIFELSTTWSRQAEISDPALATYTHTIASAFTKITDHPNYSGMVHADATTHTATQIKDYGKSGYDYTLSGGTFPTITTISSKDYFDWDGATNFLSDGKVFPVGDYSLIYVGQTTNTSVWRSIMTGYPDTTPKWRFAMFAAMIKLLGSVDAFSWVTQGTSLFLFVVSYDCKTQTFSYSLDGGTVSTSVSPGAYYLNGNANTRLSIGGRETAAGVRDDFLGEGAATDYTAMLAWIASDIHNDGTGAGIISDLKTEYSIS